MKNGIVIVNKEFSEIPEFNNITILGDPGCDGLGAGTMSIFAKALTCRQSDFSIIVGDIVHRGIKPLYKSVTDFVNRVSLSPVYMLCGNHDTAFYDEYFGLRNYALYNDTTLFIFLDDSKRVFEEHTLSFLEKSLKEYNRSNIVLFFHIPPPNSIGTNTINTGEWYKILNIIEEYKSKIKYIICGHVHSFYEDDLDGIKLIVTGGAGARIEFVSDKIDPQKAHHHVINLYYENEILKYEHIPLEPVSFTKELEDKNLKNNLEKSLTNEALAHIKYKLFAKDASEKGFKGLAKMFNAFADSEFYHARNHFYVLDKMKSIEENISDSLNGEKFEVEKMYKEYLEYSVTNSHGLSSYSFFDSLEAEKIHHKLLEIAIENFNEGRDIPVETYHTCSSCGFTFKGDVKPQNCPICGAPHDKIFEVN